MMSRNLLASAVLVASAWLSPLHAQTATAPATTRPATTRPAVQASNDPNWIGPKSWERRFTIPAFVMTSKGLSLKTATTRPASAHSSPISYFASRHRRSSSGTSDSGTSSSSSTSSRKSRSSDETQAYSEKPSRRSSRRGSEREGY